MYEMQLTADLQAEWQRCFSKMVFFWKGNVLPAAAAGLSLSSLPQPSVLTPPRQRPSPLDSALMAPAAPVFDQTPGLRPGKRVFDPAVPQRLGIVKRIKTSKDGREGPVIAWDGEEMRRERVYVSKGLAAVPIEQPRRPDQAGQRVAVVGGRRIELRRLGTLVRFNTEFSFVQLDGAAEGGQPSKIRTSYLHAVEEGRPVSAPAAAEPMKVPVDKLMEFFVEYTRKNKVTLVARTTIAGFVEKVRALAAALGELQGKGAVTTRSKNKQQKKGKKKAQKT